MTTQDTPHTPRGPRWLQRYTQLAPTRRNLTVSAYVIAASFADGFGIATLLPMIAVLGDRSAHHSALANTMLEMLHKVGIAPDPRILLGLVVAGTLIKAVLILLSLRQIGYAVADVTAKLRVQLVNGLIGARWSYYVSHASGRFSNALSDEATKAGQAYSAAMLMLSQIIQAVVYIGIAALLSWKLALFALLVSAIMLGSLNRFVQTAKRNASIQTRLLRTVLERLSEVLLGIKPLKAMARDGHVVQLFKKDLGDMQNAARRQVFASNANRALQEPIIALCLAFGIFAALRMLNMPLGEVIVMSLLLAKTALVVGRSQQQLNELHSSEPGLKSVQRTIAETLRAADPPGGGATPRFTRRIEFDDVSFAHGKRPTLQHVSVVLESGEVAIVTGPSGAGKTTFIDLLLGLYVPGSGEVRVDGTSLRALNRTQWRRQVGYAPQEVILFHDTVTANLTLGEAGITAQDLEDALRDAECWQFVQELPEGMDTVVGERGGALSGGQRQRLALARALVRRPRLLILDEATSALDPATEAAVIANIRRRATRDGVTVLAVSHHPAWVREADRVLRMQAGRLSIAAPGDTHA
ncbi:MAG: ABC transporter ATP-binding protein [Nevskiaceae bacterium]|nr:MAG: ABC transporter ATP-binding protein [Nevskiaceae bacterium]TBR72594.1 MAG: ABC transporter ATP-binding protein [Nevskiaceae bacterium]